MRVIKIIQLPVREGDTLLASRGTRPQDFQESMSSSENGLGAKIYLKSACDDKIALIVFSNKLLPEVAAGRKCPCGLPQREVNPVIPSDRTQDVAKFKQYFKGSARVFTVSLH